jgi:hypothetical protein
MHHDIHHRGPITRRGSSAMIARLAVMAVIVMLGGPPAAHASSIVHIRADQVWLIDPDSGREHQVTTSGYGYTQPSQADNGTIAVSGRLLRQNGDRIATAAEGEISPDGVTIASSGVKIGCTQYCGGTKPGVVHGFTDFFATQGGAPVEHEFEWRIAGWGDSSRALMMTNGTLGLFGPDGVDSNGETWFAPERTVHDGDWTSASGGMLALTSESGGETILELFRAAGPPQVPTSECYFRDAGGNIEDPTWSPDGTRVAWESSAGIEVATIPNLDDCSSLEARLLVPGGKDPHWSAAAMTAQSVATTALDARFRPGRRMTTVRRLWLRDVPAGTRVTLRCSARNCRRGPATVRVTRAAALLNLRARLRRHALPAGTRLEIVATEPGKPARAWRIRIRRDRVPRVTAANRQRTIRSSA